MRYFKRFIIMALIVFSAWIYAGCDAGNQAQPGGNEDRSVGITDQNSNGQGSKQTKAQRVGEQVNQFIEEAKQKTDQAISDIDK